jgi:hypothetical protein
MAKVALTNSRARFKSLGIAALVLEIPLNPPKKGDFEWFGFLLKKEG